jgi:photosystem II stability/assembly factor-like uncharacterized protein
LILNQTLTSSKRFLVIICFSIFWLVSCTDKQWRSLSTDTLSHDLAISDIKFLDSNHGWALTPSQLLETFDGGYKWAEKLEGKERSFYSMEFVDSATGWIVGSQINDNSTHALVLQTLDEGESWHSQQVDIDESLLSVSFYNSKIGAAAGKNHIIYTSDGGQTWKIIYKGNNVERLRNIVCISAERIVAIGEDGLILFTEDSGKNWKHQEIEKKSTLLRVRFFGNKGWIVGLNGVLLSSSDSGMSWIIHPLKFSTALTDIYINDLEGWIVGEDGIILKSTDGGQTWQQQISPTNQQILCLFFINPNKGWAGGQRLTFLSYP